MKLQFSPKLVAKLRKDNTLDKVLSYIKDKTLFNTIVKWVTNWKYKNVRVNLCEWVKENAIVPEEVQNDLKHLKEAPLSDKTIQEVLLYVRSNLTYKGDKEVWEVNEYWQPTTITWRKKTGDCEDGAILIYAILNWLGYSDDRVFIVAGDVKGGGHCYVVYMDEDALEYPIDWCYWYNQSVQMFVPYVLRTEYYGGNREWFRVNKTSSYKRR
jgi:predicted transglutaminase-like cysteine proteinase